MRKIDIIEKEFLHRAMVRGRLYLFHPKEAIEVVRRCAQLGITILGIDAFIVSENSIQPLMEHSIDYSTQSKGNDIWLIAENFILTRANQGLMFEVVYE